MDTAGQEDYKELRVLGLNNTDCFIVCFSVADSVTFRNVTEVWLPEIRSRVPRARILLVGTKSDLRAMKLTQSLKRKSLRNKEVG